MLTAIKKGTLFAAAIAALFYLEIPSVTAQKVETNWEELLRKQEEFADAAITRSYQEIEKMYFLSQKKVKNPSEGMSLTVEKKDNQVIFLLKGHKYRENYDKELIGYDKDSITFTFQNEKISQAERIFLSRTFASEQSMILRIMDQSPSQEKHNDIQISRIQNGETTVLSSFGKFKNTSGNPERIKLKNAYADYLKGISFILTRVAFETQKFEQSSKGGSGSEIFPDLIQY